MTRLLVVVVNYRVADLTIDCLRSIRDEVQAVPAARVVVCENGSEDDSEERLRRAIREQGWGQWVEFRTVGTNLGFTGGNNAILGPALESGDRPEYFLLLNADTIVRPGALKELVDFMDAHPRVGVAGSRLENPDGSPQCSAFRYQNPISEFDGGLRLGFVSRLLSRWWVCPPISEVACPAEWVSGASMIVRRQVFEGIGLLDEGLYTYFDDIDFCLRARRAGWATWYVPSSRVVHLGGMSTGIDRKGVRPKRKPDYWFQARRRHFLKNHGPVYAALCDAAFLAGFSLWRVRRVIQRKPDLDPPHLLWDFFRNSVFCTGFRVREVANPALVHSAGGGNDRKGTKA